LPQPGNFGAARAWGGKGGTAKKLEEFFIP